MPLSEYLADQAMVGAALDEVGQPVEPPAPEPWRPGPYKLGSGDIVGVTISGLEALGMAPSQQLRVTDRGEIYLPMVGRVQVGDMSLDQVEEKVRAEFVPKFLRETDVMVQIVRYEPISVMVLGDVLRLSGGAQMVELRRDKASVLQALLSSGGAQDYGGKVTVIPARDPLNSTVYDLTDRADLVRAARIGSVEEADLVFVDARPNDAVYVQGLVNSPGPIYVARNTRLTVLQAIGAAGGTMLAFEPREATLMRHESDGQLTSVRIDLDRVKAGTDPDIALAAGDILILPHNAATRIEEYIARALQIRLGAGIETTYNPWTLYYLRKTSEMGRGDAGFYGTLYNSLQTGLVQPFVTQMITPPAP
ncbi:MAG: polysaccharide biosynthesis/export family protein [Phycisphaerae bacterium]|nr:polysaccharide biosynthesis/export family protein [Phycisphaerae bacterium]